MSNNPPTLDDLQGEWKIVTVGQNGGKAPFFVPWLMKPRLQVKGDRYREFLGKKLVGKGRIRVKPKGDYSIFDEKIEGGDEDGQVHKGIIRRVGKKLEHLQGKVGEDRPENLPYTSESMVGYAVLKRVR